MKPLEIKPLEIKGARTRLGYTQQQIADLLDMSVHSYQKKESGHIKFTESEKFALAKILGLSLEQLNDFLFDSQMDIFLPKNHRLVEANSYNG